MTPASLTHRYRAYGLSIESPWPLPELERCENRGPADVVFCEGQRDRQPEIGADGNSFLWDGDVACYRRIRVGCFWIERGSLITVARDEQADERSLRLSMLGPCLGMVMQQRGYHLLHGSAVSVGGVGVAFVGRHGAGKSTMAATLQSRGHSLITDDVLPLDLDACGDGESPRLIPSYSQIKLWPDAAVHLGHEPEELPSLHADVPKRGLRDDSKFTLEALPLACVYVLGLGDRPDVHQVSHLESYLLLTQQWYGQRFGPEFLDGIDKRRLFLQTTKLASSVAVRLLARPADLDQIEQVAELVEQDVV